MQQSDWLYRETKRTNVFLTNNAQTEAVVIITSKLISLLICCRADQKKSILMSADLKVVVVVEQLNTWAVCCITSAEQLISEYQHRFSHWALLFWVTTSVSWKSVPTRTSQWQNLSLETFYNSSAHHHQAAVLTCGSVWKVFVASLDHFVELK